MQFTEEEEEGCNSQHVGLKPIYYVVLQLRQYGVGPADKRQSLSQSLSKALRRAGWQVRRLDLLDYNSLVHTTPTPCLRPCVGSKNMSSPIRSVNCSHFVMLSCSELTFNCMTDGKGLNKSIFCSNVWLA